MDGFYAFDLHNEEVLDDPIDAVAQFESFAVIDHWQSHLLRNEEALLAEFVSEAGFVGAFQKSGAELRMNLHRG